ncbi:hypothetical protein BMS3Bbin06_02293 [bacterium BMS3Bbin06]|nr:hypothetical protein BMS3Abin08_01294 [bacterium BMS3Abin08]GBE35749.1 hypothetical protein BMS3Bbin06_02293 [bacterium BMS3Bbin06]HDO35554.1 hypothetical protein [Nitrospirota bacterium]HDY72203.1 hypothetical protein [Nitrospirota bacterium]
MPVAGAVVVPMSKDVEGGLVKRLKGISSVEVKDVGPKGVAIVLEADSTQLLKEISEEINQWGEVIEFDLVYLNWEDADKNVKPSILDGLLPKP